MLSFLVVALGLQQLLLHLLIHGQQLLLIFLHMVQDVLVALAGNEGFFVYIRIGRGARRNGVGIDVLRRPSAVMVEQIQLENLIEFGDTPKRFLLD